MIAVIIIPTFNERENIGCLIDSLQVQFKPLNHEMHILVVDDNSPDQTARIVEDASKRYLNVHLLSGRKAGLGAAYIRGMRHALSEFDAGVIFEMDADFSHNPKDVPRLLTEIEAGADFVIGSRYVRGGSVPKEWGLFRRLNSGAGNFVARHLAGLYHIRDCTAGFRAIRTSYLKKIDFEGLRVQGYAFQVALLHEIYSLGAVIKEIPVDFVERRRGKSKLGITDIIEFIINAWWIRFHNSITFINLAIVGVIGIGVNIGLFTLLLHAGANNYIASAVSLEAAALHNLFVNARWTFQRRKGWDDNRSWRQKIRFGHLFPTAVSLLTFAVIQRLLPDISPQMQQLASIAPGMAVNYFLYSLR